MSLYAINPTALRKAKIVYNFGLSECNRVKESLAEGVTTYFRRICSYFLCMDFFMYFNGTFHLNTLSKVFAVIQWQYKAMSK